MSLGTFAYLLDHDLEIFKKNLKGSVKARQELFEHFEAGDPVDLSLVSLQEFEALFHALATGDSVVARDFASHLGGYPDIEPKYATPSCIDLAYTLKFFVERDLELAKIYLERLKQH